jgi:hypothetical protein
MRSLQLFYHVLNISRTQIGTYALEILFSLPRICINSYAIFPLVLHHTSQSLSPTSHTCISVIFFSPHHIDPCLTSNTSFNMTSTVSPLSCLSFTSAFSLSLLHPLSITYRGVPPDFVYAEGLFRAALDKLDGPFAVKDNR